MKSSQIDIVLAETPYRVRISPQKRDRFYDLVRLGALNKVLRHTPLLEDMEVEELWSILDTTSAKHALMEHLLRSLTSVSGDDTHPAIVPDNMITEMIQSLDDVDTRVMP